MKMSPACVPIPAACAPTVGVWGAHATHILLDLPQLGSDRGCQAHLRGSPKQHDIFVVILMAITLAVQLIIINLALAHAVRCCNMRGQLQLAPQAAHAEAVCGVP